MTEISQRQLIFLLSSIGLIALPHILQVPMLLFGFFAFLWSWRFVGIWRKTLLPNNVMTFLLMLTGIGLLILQYRGVVFGRDAGTGLFIVALGLKLLEIKTQRDIYLITYLAFIVAATEFLYLQNVFMAVYILAVCCLLLCTLIAINNQNSKTFASLKIAGTIVLQALPIMIALFVLFPRLEPPRWSLLKENHKTLSGLSDTLELDTMSKLALSYDLAFRVKFEGKIPPPNQRYWRGVVYSQTDGKKWFQSSNMHFGHFMDKPTFSGEPYVYTLMMEAQSKNWVFGLETPAAFSYPLSRNEHYQLITQNNPAERAEYKITSYPNYNTGYITKTEHRDNLQLPAKPAQRILDLVKQLNGFDAAPDIFIKNVLNHFHNEKFSYTLAPPLMSDNPIESFLFDEKKGFCSHYATAFVYLMRVADIPARVVGGYQGGELNKIGNFLEIRQANAHAWAEVWLKGKGWVRVDPTTAIAPERVEQEVDVSAQIENGELNFESLQLNNDELNWLKTARHLWENVDYSWQRWVINYNNQNQAKFLATIGIHNLKVMMYWLLYCIALIVTLTAWFLLHKEQKMVDNDLLIYEIFCKKLAKIGFAKKPTEGAKDFATRVINFKPELEKQILEITTLFIQIRYGKSNGEVKELETLKKLVIDFLEFSNPKEATQGRSPLKQTHKNTEKK